MKNSDYKCKLSKRKIITQENKDWKKYKEEKSSDISYVAFADLLIYFYFY